MSLSTHVAFGAPINPEELFDLCRALLFETEKTEGAEPRDPNSVPIKRETWQDGRAVLFHPPMMGLPAWLFLHHGDGKPLPTPEGDDVERYRDEPTDNGWAYAYVDFDTAYGYRHPALGFGCTGLHMRYIRVLFEWATQRTNPIPMKWRNEYSGEWFDGLDGLDQFAENGDKAANWFSSTAMPAIRAHIAAGSPPEAGR